MIFEAGEPECLQWQPMIFPIIVDAASGANAAAVMRAAMLASADDAPGPEATTSLAHATIHSAVTGAAAQTSVGASGAAAWANSIAVN